MSFINNTNIVIPSFAQNPYHIRGLSKGQSGKLNLCGHRESDPNLILGKDVFYH